MPILYPKVDCYKKGYLAVSEGHKLYFELCGNPKGKPVMFLHGGPGAGISERDRGFFNPKLYDIILFDQRGAGRSKPFVSLKNNTTYKLIQDIRKILRFLRIKKVFLFGGSWGSTLALAYAIKYPKTVSGMLLRGIYLARPKDDEHYLSYAKRFNPEAWHRLMNNVPKEYRKEVISYYHKQMQSKNLKIRNKFAYEWARYEISISRLNITEEDIEKVLKSFSYKSLSILEVYYLKNKCFLQPNYILKNAHKISKIPISIVHGKYDLICPPEAAYELNKKLRNSKLYFVVAGHSVSEKEIQKKLVFEMDKIYKII